MSGADGADFGALVPFFYSAPRDARLPIMERVLCLQAGDEALAIPYSHLEIEPVMHVDVAGRELAVFFQRGTTSSLDTLKIPEGRDVGTTGVFEPVLGDTTLTFRAEGGEIVDRQTGSTWNILGRATSGPLKGKELMPVVHQGGQLWFSWAAFHPDTVVYGEGQESRRPVDVCPGVDVARRCLRCAPAAGCLLLGGHVRFTQSVVRGPGFAPPDEPCPG